MQLVPTATVSGTITSTSGALPQLLSVGLVPAGAQTEMLGGAGLRGPSAQVARTESTLRRRGARAYTIKADRRQRGAGAAANATDAVGRGRRERERTGPRDPADAPARRRHQRTRRLRGRAAGGRRAPGAVVRADAAWIGRQGVCTAAAAASMAQGRFTFAGVTPDTYQFTATLDRAGREREMGDQVRPTRTAARSFERRCAGNPNETLEWHRDLQTARRALAGTLTDPGCRPATATTTCSSSHPTAKHWTPGSRRVRMTRPATDCSYIVNGLPPR
jgi:hypothetical protein